MPRSTGICVGRAPGWHSDGILRHAGSWTWAIGCVCTATCPTIYTALMHGARFFRFPSLYEGFGLPVLEAQAQGVPVKTSTNLSPKSLMTPRFLVDPTDVGRHCPGQRCVSPRRSAADTPHRGRVRKRGTLLVGEGSAGNFGRPRTLQEGKR
ncbi:MAG: glycosyltransferase [Caldilineaceae bacterium]